MLMKKKNKIEQNLNRIVNCIHQNLRSVICSRFSVHGNRPFLDFSVISIPCCSFKNKRIHDKTVFPEEMKKAFDMGAALVK